MDRVTFPDLINLFGQSAAFEWLQNMEELGQLTSVDAALEPDARLAKALEAINTINFAE